MTNEKTIKEICSNVLLGKYSSDDFYQRLQTVLIDENDTKLQKKVDEILQNLERDIYCTVEYKQAIRRKYYANQLLSLLGAV